MRGCVARRGRATRSWASSTTTRPNTREHIHGVPVLGHIAQVRELSSATTSNEVIVAIPRPAGAIYAADRRALPPRRRRVRTIPGVESLIEGRVRVSQLATSPSKTLLGRDPVKLDAGSSSPPRSTAPW